MLTVPEQLMHATVRIECSLDAGGTSTGTGFFFRFLDDGVNHVPVIVTNKHVIAGATRGAFHLTRKGPNGDPLLGDHHRVEFDNFQNLWIPHPSEHVDLTVFPVASVINQASKADLNYFYITLAPNLIPDETATEDLSGLDDIVMVGYPNGLWDSKNNLPIFRAGCTATHPKYDYEGMPYFLIDCACFPGSSGSPVFVYNPSGYKTRSGSIKMGAERLIFLGALFAGPQHVAEGSISVVEVPELAHVPRAISRIPNNLGFVVKSQTLLDFEPILEARRGDA
ncbi:MAG: serine protease [Pseudomonadales bacterium]